MSSPIPNNSYFPHINGLRAVAILGVLIYHLSADYCPAGYFGVDVFLVISGFLLIRSLYKEDKGQNFHYGQYLLKKAWRLLPLWFVISGITFATAFTILPGNLVVSVLKTMGYSTFFQADHFIDVNGNYFNERSQQNPLLHYWYLSITQQLYIIVPLLIIPLARWCSRRAVFTILAILFLLSLIYYILTTNSSLLTDPSRTLLLKAIGAKSAYYHLVPRFWEVLAGAAILLLPEWHNKAALRCGLGLLGLVGIVSSFYLCTTGSPAVYLTVISSLLTLRYGDSFIARQILCLAPLQALGTISFSLYLCHWPIMVFWKYCCFDAPSIWDEVGMLILSLVVASLCWWGIERIHAPKQTGKTATCLHCALLSLLPLTLIFSYALKEHYAPSNVSAKPAHADKTLQGTLLRGLELLGKHGMSNQPLLVGAPNVAPSFLLMGDSHALHLYQALDEACSAQGMCGIYLNNSAAPYWYLTHPQKGADPCCWNQEIAELIFAYLSQHPEIQQIIIAQHWARRLYLYTGTDWRTGKFVDSDEERLNLTSQGLKELCKRAQAQGLGVVLLGDTPHYNRPAPVDVWERCRKLHRPYRERPYTKAEHDQKQQHAYKLHRQLVEEGLAYYIDLATPLLENGTFPCRVDGQFLFTDSNHLSLPGARKVIHYLLPRLQEVQKRQKARKEHAGEQGSSCMRSSTSPH